MISRYVKVKPFPDHGNDFVAVSAAADGITDEGFDVGVDSRRIVRSSFRRAARFPIEPPMTASFRGSFEGLLMAFCPSCESAQGRDQLIISVGCIQKCTHA